MTRSPVPLVWVVASHRLLQNPRVPLFVIPAEAGIQGFRRLSTPWIPASAGMTRRENRSRHLDEPHPPLALGHVLRLVRELVLEAADVGDAGAVD
ncbi:MAG: hypothetical protein K0R58_1389, partial [Ramlibacter sp.]|nr:hypothetical protein [Ramlibacter sp.]